MCLFIDFVNKKSDNMNPWVMKIPSFGRDGVQWEVNGAALAAGKMEMWEKYPNAYWAWGTQGVF